MTEVQACCKDANLDFSMSLSRNTDSQFLFVVLLLYMIMLKSLRGLCIILFPIMIYFEYENEFKCLKHINRKDTLFPKLLKLMKTH